VLLADSLEADVSVDEDKVEAESGVQMVVRVGVLLLISRRSFAGGPGGGATKVLGGLDVVGVLEELNELDELDVLEVFVVVLGSYALEKVLRTVGETALSVSSRKLAPLPKMRGW
jgi:hypothetical protein